MVKYFGQYCVLLGDFRKHAQASQGYCKWAVVMGEYRHVRERLSESVIHRS